MSGQPERAVGGGPVARPPRMTGRTAEPERVLHKGFDGLDMAFTGALRAEDVTILQAARERAEQDREPILVQIGPCGVAMHVAPHGAKGGFCFVCDTGFLGETWFFGKNPDDRRWNVRVSAKSLPLAIYGIDATYTKLRDTLRALGIAAAAESVGRTDYAIDFLMDDTFKLVPEQFVAHSRTGTFEHDSALAEERIGPDDIQIYFSGRRVSSVTIGRQPGRQIIVYDKRREIVAKKKLYWFDLWNLDETDAALVFRVEFRAGKKHLRHWQIKTFDDLLAQTGDVFRHAATAVRYVTAEGSLTNISRRPLHPLWRQVQSELASGLFGNISGIVPGRFIAGERERIRLQYLEQIVALVPGALIASGYSGDRPEDKIPVLFSEVERHIAISPAKFRERFVRAQDRLHFTSVRTEEGSFG